MDTKIQNKLNSCKTVKDILDVINENFETEKTVLSPITKAVFIQGLNKAIIMTNCKQRNVK